MVMRGLELKRRGELMAAPSPSIGLGAEKSHKLPPGFRADAPEISTEPLHPARYAGP